MSMSEKFFLLGFIMSNFGYWHDKNLWPLFLFFLVLSGFGFVIG